MATTCFISYSWDSERHKNWVRRLAETLQSKGVMAHLDQWDVMPGIDLAQYMERCIRESNFVLLICTQEFARRANSGLGGVAYEKAIVTGEVFSRLAPDTKFVPLLRSGDALTSLPSYLLSRVFIDFRSEDKFDDSIMVLLRHLHGVPEFVRPPLGAKPSFVPTPAARSGASSGDDPDLPIAEFDKLYRYAYSTNGMNLTRENAIAWAEGKTTLVSTFDLKRHDELYRYAYSTNGMNLTKEQAVAWADNKAGLGESFDLNAFKKLYAYAYSTNGLNLTKEQAVKWADDKSRRNAAL